MVMPRSIYQYSGMATRGFQDKPLHLYCFLCFQVSFGYCETKKLEKFAILTRKPPNHVRILIY